jgi:RNA polymerase sigma-70 factor (ECF subfamily)
MCDSLPNLESTPEFMRLYAESSRAVYWVIRSLVSRPEDADELFQETSAVLWQKFGEFTPGTNFGAWAAQIARIEVRRYYQRLARDQNLFHNEALLEKLLARTEQIGATTSRRGEFLTRCLGELNFPDRKLIGSRYEPGMNSKKLAEQLRVSESYISKTLARIHRLLFQCIERHEAEEEKRS